MASVAAPELQLRSRSRGTAFIDLGDQFIALFGCKIVKPRSEHRHFGLVVDDVAAVIAASPRARCRHPRQQRRRSWGNRFDVVAYSDVQFMKADAVLRAQNATHLIKSDSALTELRGDEL